MSRTKAAIPSRPAMSLPAAHSRTAIKGPAAHMMRDLGLDVSVLGIARHYKDIIDGLIIDEIDRHLLPEIHALGLKAMALPTIMKNDDDRISLARSVVKAGLQWASGS